MLSGSEASVAFQEQYRDAERSMTRPGYLACIQKHGTISPMSELTNQIERLQDRVEKTMVRL